MSEHWFGVVENRHDPLDLNRCQVRIYSLHTPDLERQPLDRLPWALVSMPPTHAGVSGIGTTHGLIEGSLVHGVFVDNKQQQPLITGVISSNPVWSEQDREKIIQESEVFARLSSMFNDTLEVQYDELPDDIDLRRDLQVRFDYEGPHIVIKPNLDYENRLSASMPAYAGFESSTMNVFRHLAAIFSSNINYLCVSNGGRIGKYQFTPKFLNSKGISGQEQITGFMHDYSTQESNFVSLVSELSGQISARSNRDAVGMLMVGVLVEDGLNRWSDTEDATDGEGRSTIDAYMKGLLAYYHMEQM